MITDKFLECFCIMTYMQIAGGADHFTFFPRYSKFNKLDYHVFHYHPSLNSMSMITVSLRQFFYIHLNIIPNLYQ
jgi:hypothetical protein